MKPPYFRAIKLAELNDSDTFVHYIDLIIITGRYDDVFQMNYWRGTVAVDGNI